MFKEIVIGDVCQRPIHFDKYEFFVQFITGECDLFIVSPASGLSTANLLEKAKGMAGNEAYELLRGFAPLDWPVDLGSGDWADISSFTMYYYNFRGVKRHVILK